MAEPPLQGLVRPLDRRTRLPIPSPLLPAAHRVRDVVTETAFVLPQVRRWVSILRAPVPRDELRVSYGWPRLPAPDELAYGGLVKFQGLDESLPNAAVGFNVLYLGSTSMPLDARMLVALARRRGAAFVWNQNGVCYPGWFGSGCERINRPRARLLHAADHVVYQSAFCKLSADRFYGARRGPWEVIHNPVDTERFRPDGEPADRPPTLLLGGNQYQRYRLETALRTIAEVRRRLPEARLLIAGAIAWHADPARALAETERLIRSLGLEGSVELTGAYTQAEAPALMRRADVLLHTKYNDPCPTVVLEAMASGLAIVYSASGGVPELVGEEAGIGVPAPLDFDRDHPPAPDELAGAVIAALERLPELRAAARARAVERFDLKAWATRHRALFEELVLASPGQNHLGRPLS